MSAMENESSNFQQIDKAFRLKILRYLTHLVGEFEAEDLTQEVFIKILRNLNNFRGESQLSTWIYKIATNVAMDAMRSPVRLQKIQFIDFPDIKSSTETHLELPENSPSAELRLIRKQMNACIRGYIDGLPENYRTVLVLSDLEGLNVSDTAAVLGISLHTAKIRLHRARAKLKKELETHCNFYRDEQNELACDLKTAMDQFKSS